jgi:PPK2 family polyphosphate:nucleotide phosphotransferase
MAMAMAMAAPSFASLTAPYRRASPAASFGLKAIAPRATPLSLGSDDTDKAEVDKLAKCLADLRDVFHADRRFRLLVVLQGLDASGKDGTLRHVFGRMGPQALRSIGWRAPSPAERAHDPLWRIHQAVPADGEIVVFNRSHCEDVIVHMAQRLLPPTEIRQRLRHINDFERMLAETGTVIVKFMLHVSRAEQGRRLQARLDDPEKRWKFDPSDLEVRRHWAAYQAAYDEALGRTCTRWAPWTVVPADSKVHRNLMVAAVLVERLWRLGLRYPPGEPGWANRRIR